MANSKHEEEEGEQEEEEDIEEDIEEEGEEAKKSNLGNAVLLNMRRMIQLFF